MNRIGCVRFLPLRLTSAMLIAALAACSTPPQAPPSSELGMYVRLERAGTQLDEASALSLINAYRANRGLAPLVWDPALAALGRDNAARAGAEDRSTFGEVPNLTGPAAAQKATVRLSAGYLTMAEAFSGWRDVPAQNKAMLDPSISRIGIAAVRTPSAKYRVYWALATAP